MSSTLWRRVWPWLLIPGLTFGALEAYARATVARVPTWYRAAGQIAREQPVGTIFLGSSRTQAALVPRAFEEALSARGVFRARSLNLGRGHTTDAEHYLGLRLLAAQPRRLEGLVVFAEMGSCVPWPSRWERQPWAFEQAPEILVDVIGFRDLPALWRSAGLDREMRAHVTLRTLLRPFASISRRVHLRRHLSRTLRTELGVAVDPLPEPRLGADLEGPGPASSIRTDPAAVERARASALEVAGQMSRKQPPLRPWTGTIVEDTVRLVQSHGGRIVFFQVPVSEVFARVDRTPIRQADIAAFAEQARRWGVCVLRPSFTTTEEDFPDLWHLRPERAPEFSAVLARAWLDECR